MGARPTTKVAGRHDDARALPSQMAMGCVDVVRGTDAKWDMNAGVSEGRGEPSCALSTSSQATIPC
jgi:hypothetical protein